MSKLVIVPAGPEISVELLDEVSAFLAREFSSSCHVESDKLDVAFAWSENRNQYYSTAILKRLAEHPGSDRILGITDCDLYVPVLTFVFGEAQIGGRAALVSCCRLRQEFYGLPPDSDLLHDRLAKEAAHELGHTLGLRHCGDWRCVMSSSHSVERIDLKDPVFCAECARLRVPR